MARVLILLIANIILAGCGTQLVLDKDAAVTVVPHRAGESDHIVVETMVNGAGPFRFMLDTGASISVVFESTRAAAAIEPLEGMRAHVLGMTGTGTYPVADVAQISVGHETWNDARVAVLPDLAPVAGRLDGILGIDFISRYAVWYSPEDQMLRFYPKQLTAEPTYLEWMEVGFWDLRVGDGDLSVFAFDIFVSGERIPTVFDLGSDSNIMNVKAARRLDIFVRRPRKQSNIHGITGQTPVLAELHVWRLEIGRTSWRNRLFLVGEFPVFELLELNRRPAALAGTSFFKDRDLIIDFSRKRLLVQQR